MPELPEVETVVRGIRPLLLARSILKARVLHKPSVGGSPRPLSFLEGRRIENVFRRGKFIRMALSGDAALAVHLRMTGWLGVSREVLEGPHLRVAFDLDDGRHLLFRDIRTFGRVWCGERERIERLKALAKLGPEPLEIAAGEFIARLRSRGGGLKALLLNQEFLAGVGNIYSDEALHAARLHPLQKASRVAKHRAAALHAAIRKVLEASIRAGGSSIENFRHADGGEGWFQRELLAYGREGQPCRRCRAPIKRIVVGQRGTWFCPRCQRR